MGYWHGRAARHSGADLVGIVDKNSQRANALARTLRVGSVATDASDLLERHRVDAVHICTPLATHLALSSWAIEAGVHALVEKPLVVSARETSSLLDLAQKRAVVLCPVHQLAFQDGVAFAERVLPRLGDISAIDIRICSAGGVGRPKRELDKIVGDILPHPLSILRKLWPRATWQPELWFVTRAGGEGELGVSGLHAGALLSMLVSMRARPTCFKMTVLGSAGAVELDFFHGFALRHDGRVSRLRKMTQPFRTTSKLFGVASVNLLGRALRHETAYPGLRSLTRAFYGAVLSHSASPVSGEDTIAVAVARDVILAAAAATTTPAEAQPHNKVSR
jgi:predicted dehydrogenase